MPTKMPRLTFTLPQGVLDAVDAYRRQAGLKNQTAAVLDLLRRGLTAGGQEASALSPEAEKLAALYDGLDAYGRDAVRRVAAVERDRCADEARFLSESAPRRQPVVINLFEDAAAAGLALGETGQAATPYVLTEDDPAGASYAVRVSGDSMDPWFPDGSVVFVNHDQMWDGDVGVFCVDGATVVKQWHRDALGVTYLFSLNRRRADADVIVPPGAQRSLVWQGRVMTHRRFPLPEKLSAQI